MTAKGHNRLIGILLMVYGGIQALVMSIICLVYGIMAVAAMTGGPSQQRFVGIFFVVIIAFILIITALSAGSQILGGYKLFKERPDARIWGIIASIVSCTSFPLGTAVGVYGLWFLFGDTGKQMHLESAMPQPMFENAQQQYQEPPPPNHWQ